MSKDNKKSIDDMMLNENLHDDGLLEAPGKRHMFNEGLVQASHEENFFEEDEEEIQRKKRKAKASILLEQKKISQNHKNSGHYINKGE